MSAAVTAIQESKADKSTVIELVLTGTLNLNRIALDQSKAGLEIAGQAGVFAVSTDTTRLNIGNGFASGSADGADLLPRDELERRAILQLVGEQALWGLHDDQQTFADLFYDLKELVRTGEAGEIIASRIPPYRIPPCNRACLPFPLDAPLCVSFLNLPLHFAPWPVRSSS